MLGNEYVEILEYTRTVTEEILPRDNYKEFLELIIFLGGISLRGIKFRKPDAFHLVKYITKSIYSINIYLFNREFQLTGQEEKSRLQLNTFIGECYAISWFSSPKADEAPLNDIKFLRKLHNYRDINENVATAATKKFINNLYYLNEECVVFSLFGNRITLATKLKIAEKILKENENQEDEEEDIIKKCI